MLDNNSEILPWWQPAWGTLMTRRCQETLPHALLVTGPRGLGKHRFARALAKAAVCEQPAEEGACGHCTSCTRFDAGSHPDYRMVEPAEAGRGILVDQVRVLCAGLGLMSHSGGYKAALIAPAERMNAAAANSLLKTLEEPSDKTVILLVTERPMELPATIRSRCQQVRLAPPPRDQGRAWLARRVPGADPDLLLDLAGGAPLEALALEERGTPQRRRDGLAALTAIRHGGDPLPTAAQWARETEGEPLDWLADWLMDMLRLKMGATPPRVSNDDLRKELRTLGESVDCRELLGFFDQVLEARRLAATPVNRQLLFEDLLVHWARLGRGPQPTGSQVQA
ncbi:MAG TPA: DNA polymerase III subunit delta' [Gammaproteobacteria bacterium]|nr:DNA polymerase III subunit delta' [Gammaproteobacteria bacterium]